MLDEYFKTNEFLRNEILNLKKLISINSDNMMQEIINTEAQKRTLELEVQHLKDYIKYTL